MFGSSKQYERLLAEKDKRIEQLQVEIDFLRSLVYPITNKNTQVIDSVYDTLDNQNVPPDVQEATLLYTGMYQNDQVEVI